MPPLPKRKYPKARQGKRRNHLGVAPPTVVKCSQCNSPKLPHHACPVCGYYGGREAVEIKVSTPKAS
jgi:large subunit ribosomal protein L32